MDRNTGSIALSVVVPCYNAERYLSACLDSLIAQTLENIEVVCVNDGSTDGSIKILRDYERRFPGKVFVVDKANEGAWRTRLRGVEEARGEYIGFLDSDDTASPDFAESLYQAAKLSDADIAVCGFSRIELDSGRLLSREMTEERQGFQIDHDPGRLVELNGAQWNKCYRASLLKSMPTVSTIPRAIEDLIFNLLVYMTSHGSVVFVPRSGVNYMVHSGSAINSIREDQVPSVLSSFLEVRALYERNRPDLIPVLDAIAFLHLGVSLVFRRADGEGADFSLIIRQTTNYLDKNFPTWRHSPYMRLRYALPRGGALTKLWVVQNVYKLHLLRAFLAIYRFIINRLHIDIKW